jgi:hypothetical protein
MNKTILKVLFMAIIFICLFNNGFAQDSSYNIIDYKVYIHNHGDMVRENFVLIDTPIYGGNNESYIYVNLIDIFKLYETEVEINIYNDVLDSVNSIDIQIGDQIFRFEKIMILFKDEKNILLFKIKSLTLIELRSAFINSRIAFINNEYYITLDLFQFLMKCLIHIDENNNIFIWKENFYN